MPRIVIRNWSGKALTVTETTKPLLRHFQDAYLDWMHACGGKGRCTTCKAIVLEGMEHFTPLSPAEKRYREQGLLHDNERLSCQARITGDITIAVPDAYKFPHVQYD